MKAIRDGIVTIDDFVNIGVFSQLDRLGRMPDGELERLLDSMRNQDSKAFKESEKCFPSRDAQIQFLNQMIPEIERILFLREHRRRYYGEGSKEIRSSSEK